MSYSYSPYFKTILDTKAPTVYGRGMHLSVLSYSQPSKYGMHGANVCVIWDEDHDNRVIKILDYLYKKDLLEGVCFISEKKGNLLILTSEVCNIEINTSKIIGDYWPVSINNIWSNNSCSDIDYTSFGLDYSDDAINYIYNTGLAYDVFNSFIDNI